MVAIAAVSLLGLLISIIYSIGHKSQPASDISVNSSSSINSSRSPVITNNVENAYVNTLELNLRSGPGSDFGLITKLSQGDLVNCIERQQSSDGGSWVKVRAGSTEGWANEKLLSKDKPLQQSIQRDDFVVSLGRIGNVQVVGMTVQQASMALGIKIINGTDDVNEGCSYAEPEGGKAGFSFMVIKGRIARIDVTENNIPYEGGIRIGDSEEKVKSLFRGRLKIEPHTYDEKGHYLEVNNGNFGVVFETDGKQVTGIRSGKAPEFQYVEGCA